MLPWEGMWSWMTEVYSVRGLIRTLIVGGLVFIVAVGLHIFDRRR